MSPFWINSFHNKCAMKTWMIGNSKLMKWKTIKIQHCQNSSNMFSVYTWLITGFVTRLIRWVPLVEQELLTLPEHLSSPPVFSGVRVTRSLVLYTCMFCRSLFVLLYFFFWPLCCLFFFDIRILITPLVSSNSSSCKMPALYFTYENYCGYIYFLEYQF